MELLIFFEKSDLIAEFAKYPNFPVCDLSDYSNDRLSSNDPHCPKFGGEHPQTIKNPTRFECFVKACLNSLSNRSIQIKIIQMIALTAFLCFVTASCIDGVKTLLEMAVTKASCNFFSNEILNIFVNSLVYPFLPHLAFGLTFVSLLPLCLSSLAWKTAYKCKKYFDLEFNFRAEFLSLKGKIADQEKAKKAKIAEWENRCNRWLQNDWLEKQKNEIQISLQYEDFLMNGASPPKLNDKSMNVVLKTITKRFRHHLLKRVESYKKLMNSFSFSLIKNLSHEKSFFADEHSCLSGEIRRDGEKVFRSLALQGAKNERYSLKDDEFLKMIERLNLEIKAELSKCVSDQAALNVFLKKVGALDCVTGTFAKLPVILIDPHHIDLLCEERLREKNSSHL